MLRNVTKKDKIEIHSHIKEAANINKKLVEADNLLPIKISDFYMKKLILPLKENHLFSKAYIINVFTGKNHHFSTYKRYHNHYLKSTDICPSNQSLLLIFQILLLV